MIAAKLDILINKGTTLGPIVINCKDSNNSSLDLSGWSVYAHVRSSADTAIIVDLSPTITNATDGAIQITKTDEQTSALAVGSYFWDLLLENSSGERLGPFLAGSCDVAAVITQP
tara:strand:+ start:2825 stop:3169 length:345 start_codon:yes stop_codon:yes gene_type:complete